MSKDNKYCVYRHVKIHDGEVFYIGIGSKNRPNQITGRNIFWKRVYDKYDYEVQILTSNISHKEACELEKILINYFGRRDLKKGTLTNLTDGGEGSPNTIVSQETRDLLSKIRTGKTRSTAARSNISKSKMGDKNPMYGKKQSEETIEKKIKSLTGKKRSQETKDLLSKKAIERGENKPVLVYTTDSEYVGEYISISDAARQLDCSTSKICLVISCKRNHHKGYIFKIK